MAHSLLTEGMNGTDEASREIVARSIGFQRNFIVVGPIVDCPGGKVEGVGIIVDRVGRGALPYVSCSACY